MSAENRNRGRGGGGSSRGRGGASGGSSNRAALLDLSKYVDKELRVKLAGGREVLGILKGYDQLYNLVLDDVKEQLQDDATSRSLGLVVLRGTALTVINPADGFESISNPFAQA